MNDDQALRDFVAKYARPYDPESDDYDRPPFAADIKEGKNDPIYNAHSYHTKVPPRGIIPYILHYTKPGDLILDPFCGSGMTGVAAQMCAHPPADLLEQFPELKERVGPRHAILNDLSPAACHIAYNYNTPVDVDALQHEFERIKAAVKDEFGWLYGTKHYEPAIGLYDPHLSEVAERLKNTPTEVQVASRMFADELQRTWELIDCAEVERRLGFVVTELPRSKEWGDIDVASVNRWICIPAVIQYTIWSDVYRCEGIITVSEPTGKVSPRGKNIGKPILRNNRVARGCGKEFSLWDVGLNRETMEVLDEFKCPNCQQRWTTENATLLRAEPSSIIYTFEGFVAKNVGRTSTKVIKSQRIPTLLDLKNIHEIERKQIPYWYPSTKLVPGEQGNPFISRGISSVNAVYSRRNLHALALLFNQFNHIAEERIRKALIFVFTSVSIGLCSRMTRYNFGKRGNGAMPLRLFIPHVQAEVNVFKVLEGKIDDIFKYYSRGIYDNCTFVINKPAQEISCLTEESIDFIFADPPFGRNIAYSELNILWEAWLGKTTDVEKEAITSNARKWGLDSYAGKMAASFTEMFRVLKSGRFAMIEFNNNNPALFEAIKKGAQEAGFEIINMLLFDKEQKSFNQVHGILRGENTVDKDVIFNLRKPIRGRLFRAEPDLDIERQVVDTVREHLRTLPGRMTTDPAKYTADHRTTATINSVLMNTLIPKGISVDRLNLPFIEHVCSKYFRKINQRWYLRGEAVGNQNGSGDLLEEEIGIKDAISAIEWIRQRVKPGPILMSELKPLWMRAIGLLPAEISQDLILDDLLAENFWRDADTNRWCEPTDEERERMNDDRSLRVLHDAERFVAETLRRATTDAERCEWIEVLFKACEAVEESEETVLPTLRGFEPAEGYRLIGRLFQSVLRDKVAPSAYSRAEKQTRVASQRLSKVLNTKAQKARAKRSKDTQPTLFDLLGDT